LARLLTESGTFEITAAMKVCEADLTLVNWVTTKASSPAASTRDFLAMRSLTVVLALPVNVLDKLSRLIESTKLRAG